MKKRRGNLALVLFFGMSMAYVSIHHLTVASNLYQLQRSSAEVYSSIQTQRAATEIATAQFVSDMCAVKITKDLDAEWLNVGAMGRYYEALDAIMENLEGEAGSKTWDKTDVREVLRGVSTSDPSVTYRLSHALDADNQEFYLRILTDFELDWSSERIVSQRGHAQIPLKPLDVECYLRVKTEVVREVFTIEGLYLELMSSTIDVGGSEHDSVVFKISEDQEVFNIWRTIDG